MSTDTKFWMSLVDNAVKVWNEHDTANPTKQWSRDRILREIVPLQRKAMILSILVGQVDNGGFNQWHSNFYSFTGEQSIELLLEIDTKDSKAAAAIVREALGYIEDEDEDDDEIEHNLRILDDDMYNLENLKADIEAWFKKQAGEPATLEQNCGGSDEVHR